MSFAKNKITWDQVEFIASPTDCMRAYAYHKRDRCSAQQEQTVHMRGFAIPGIHRYRTLVGRRKHQDEVVCDACGVALGRSARQQLEKMSRHVVEMHFGPSTTNIRTDYYRALPEPFDLEELRS